MNDSGELLGYHPRTLFGGQAEVRSQLVAAVTRDMIGYAMTSNGNGRVQYEQAVYDALVRYREDLTPVEQERAMKAIATNGQPLITRLGGTAIRLFTPYSALEREVKHNVVLMERSEGTMRQKIADELWDRLGDFEAYAREIDTVVARLQRIARRKGIRYAMHQETRDRVFKSVFETSENYAHLMRKGLVNAINIDSLELITIVYETKVRKCRKTRFKLIIAHPKVSACSDEELQAGITLEFGDRYLEHTERQMWPETD